MGDIKEAPGINQSWVDRLFKMHQQYDASKIIAKYEEVLQKSYIITSSFQDIINKKVNKKQRRIQLVIHLSVAIITIRYIFFCFLYTTDKRTMNFYQYWFQDYWEALGLLGRSLNLVFATAYLPLVFNIFYLRFCEVSGGLEFLTEMQSLKSKFKVDKKNLEGFKITEKGKFLSLFYIKLLVWEFGYPIIGGTCIFLQVVGCTFFLWKVSDRPLISFLTVLNCIINCIVQQLSTLQFLSVTLSLHVTVDYFTLRIKSLIRRFQRLSAKMSEKRLSKALHRYDQLVMDFERKNVSVRFLIRSICYGYCLILSFVLFMMTVDMVWWMALVIRTSSLAYALSIIATEVYVGFLHHRIEKLYQTVNNTTARAAEEIKYRTSFKTQMHLRTAIRELGSRQTQGQFTVGFSNGFGTVFHAIDAIELAFKTCGITLLLLSSFYYA